MYKKTLLSLAVASSLALTGCFESGSDSSNAGAATDGNKIALSEKAFREQFEGKTWPVFNPAAGNLPIPNDLIFSEAGDGSFSVDIPEGEEDNPVLNALNNLSGGSTVAPYDIAFSGPIDASTVRGPEGGLQQNVFLIEVDYDGVSPLTALQQGTEPTGGAPFQDIDVEVISLETEAGPTDHIRVSPTAPLNPNKRYVLVVTDEIEVAGSEERISSSPDYANLSSDRAIPTPLQSVRGIIGLWEGVAQAGFSTLNEARQANDLDPLSTENIALSYSFTTSNDKTVLTSIANPAAWLQAQADAQGFSDELAEAGGAEALASQFDFPTPGPRALGEFENPTPANVVSALLDNFDGENVWVHQGSINLPYYLGVPDDQDGSPIRTNSWTPDNELATNIQNTIRAVTENEDFSLPWAGEEPDSTVLNANFPFPKEASGGDGIEVPMLVLTPADVTPDQLVTGLNPADEEVNFKALIFQHGITTDRSAALAFGTQLINAFGPATADSEIDGLAVFAIDQPLHGVAPFSRADQEDTSLSFLRAAQNQLQGMIDDAGGPGSAPELEAVRVQLEPENVFDVDGRNNIELLADGDLLTFFIGWQLSVDTLQSGGDPADDFFVLDEVDPGANVDPALIGPTEAATIEGVIDAGLDDAADPETNLLVQTLAGFQDTLTRAGSTIPGLEEAFDGQGVNPAENGVTERHFGYGSDAANNIIPMNFVPQEAAGESGDNFINLNNFLAGRDNLRQGSVDLMNLRATIAGLEGIDQDEVYFTGHSLGTVNGSAFVGASLTSGRDDLFVKGTHLLTPASGVVRLLENSPAFAPTILNGLAAGAEIQQGDANFETFLRVFQHAIDSTDPINFADELAVSQTLIGQVNNDETTPNAADPLWNRGGIEYGPLQIDPFQGAFKAPLSGSEPLVDVMGARSTTGAASDAETSALPAITRYTKGLHGTPVLPQADVERDEDGNITEVNLSQDDANDVFAEMIGQTIQLMTSDEIIVQDADVADVSGD